MARLALKIEYQIHKSVMIDEVMEMISPAPGGIYVDATLGLGGYSNAILELTDGQAQVICFDVDSEAISYSKARLAKYGQNATFVNENFVQIDEVLHEMGINEVDGIVADFGISSYQIESSGKGFSFLRDEYLDMRMDSNLEKTAGDYLNTLDAGELASIIKTYGEEKWAKNIAKCIVKSRAKKQINTTFQLVDIINKSIPVKFHPRAIHPATKTFQALRILVNNELDNIRNFIDKTVDLLKPGGRIAAVSFHSLEDRIVKNAFKRFASPCTCPPKLPQCLCGKKPSLEIMTRSPQVPSMQEVMDNKRARSAKLRVGKRI